MLEPRIESSDEAVPAGRAKPGDTIATAGFGAGRTWGSVMVKWG